MRLTATVLLLATAAAGLAAEPPSVSGIYPHLAYKNAEGECGTGAVVQGVLTSDAASLVTIDDAGRRWRLPKGQQADESGPIPLRVCREVCTERDLFHAGGHFYDLPAENAGGFAKMRPIASHPYRITDYCSWHGLLVISGMRADAAASPHVIRYDDGHAAVWIGAVDDLWRLGKPVGHGGPWKNTAVKAGLASDAYLMTGFDAKTLEL